MKLIIVMAFLQMKGDNEGSKQHVTLTPKGGHFMYFYTEQHKYYCGIDLHARKMFVCILNQQGKVEIHQNIKTEPEPKRGVLTRSSPRG